MFIVYFLFYNLELSFDCSSERWRNRRLCIERKLNSEHVSEADSVWRDYTGVLRLGFCGGKSKLFTPTQQRSHHRGKLCVCFQKVPKSVIKLVYTPG